MNDKVLSKKKIDEIFVSVDSIFKLFVAHKNKVHCFQNVLIRSVVVAVGKYYIFMEKKKKDFIEYFFKKSFFFLFSRSPRPSLLI